jgi:hypothetical protein
VVELGERIYTADAEGLNVWSFGSKAAGKTTGKTSGKPAAKPSGKASAGTSGKAPGSGVESQD